MKIETQAIHSGYSPDPTTKSVATPIYQTTSYAFDNAQHGADLFSLEAEGNIHWFCDTFFSEKTPVIGSFVIFSFREHHTHPHLITEDKFIEQDTTSFFVLLIPLISAVYSDSIYPQNLGAYLFHSGLALSLIHI